MLREALAWLVTPASGPARRLGYLAEGIAMEARQRRCADAWAPHLEASRRTLLASAQGCPSRRLALVLGSGPLLDIPLADLAALFEEVRLVDMAHPLAARRQARCHANVLLVERDVTGCLADLSRPPAEPTAFLDEPRVDWVASVNLLSQLPVLPLRRLRGQRPARAEADLAAFGEALMRHHLAYLARFPAPVCLICDVEQTHTGPDGGILEQVDFGGLLAGWRREAEWFWELAPPGELGGGRTARHRVGVFRRPASAAGTPGRC